MNMTVQLVNRLSIDPWLRAQFLRERTRRGTLSSPRLTLELESPPRAGVPWVPCPLFGDPGSEHPDPDPPPVAPGG